MSLHSLLAIPILLFGCSSPEGGGGPDEHEPGSADDDDDATPYEPPGPWEDLEYLERIEYMEYIVEPSMRELFQEFDGELYADFGCETCHGEDPVDAEFEMPSGVLEPLSIAEINGLSTHPDPDIRRYSDFMGELKATMAPLIGQEPFPEGDFSCFDCHEQE